MLMNKALSLKIVNHAMNILVNYKGDIAAENINGQLREYVMARTGLEMGLSIVDVKHAVESYRKSELF